MEQVTATLTILFAEPFWIGVYERTDQSGYQVCRTVFGAEPSNGQVYAWLEKSFRHLPFTPVVEQEAVTQAVRNPKRLQRQIGKALRQTGDVGTKAQQALKLQQQQAVLERKTQQKQRREKRQQQQYMLRQQKKKAKHRGR